MWPEVAFGSHPSELMNRKVSVSFRCSQAQKSPGEMEPEDKTAPSLGTGMRLESKQMIVVSIKSAPNGQRGSMCSLSVTSDLEIQEGYFALQRWSSAAKQCSSLHTAAAVLLTQLLYRLPPPLPLHFVATVTLTLNSQVGRCRGRDTKAVARTAGVFPGILRLDPEDDEGAVDENAHSKLQITAGRHRRSVTHSNRPT